MTNKDPAERDKLLGQMFFSPADMTDLVVRYSEVVAKQEGHTWGMQRVDDQVSPLMPGQVATILGRPANGKSTLLGWHARRAARLCAEGEIVVHLTHEQRVEQADTMFWAGESFSTTDLIRGKVPVEALRAAAPARARLPIWVMGESVIEQFARRLRLTAAEAMERR